MCFVWGLSIALAQKMNPSVQSRHLNRNQLTELSPGLVRLNQLTNLNLDDNKLASVKGLGQLTHLKRLDLYNNPNVTKVQIDQLQKTLPKCKIVSDHD